MRSAARRPKQRGSPYDGSVAQFSPDGSIQQVEYAEVAVSRSEPAAAVVLPNELGITLAARVRPRIPRCLLVNGHYEKIFQIDSHVACVVAGIGPDATALVAAAREAALQHRTQWGEPMPVTLLAKHVSNQVQAFTQYGGNRPFGASLLIAGWDAHGGTQLIRTDPSGNYYSHVRRDGGSSGSASEEEEETGGGEVLSGGEKTKDATATQELSSIAPAPTTKECVVVVAGRDSPSLTASLKRCLARCLAKKPRAGLSTTAPTDDSISSPAFATDAAAAGDEGSAESEESVATAVSGGNTEEEVGAEDEDTQVRRGCDEDSEVVAAAHLALKRALLWPANTGREWGEAQAEEGEEGGERAGTRLSEEDNGNDDNDNDDYCHLEVATLLFVEEASRKLSGDGDAANHKSTTIRRRPVVVFGSIELPVR